MPSPPGHDPLPGHGHSHGHGLAPSVADPSGAPRSRRERRAGSDRLGRVLAAVVVTLGVAAVVIMVLTWPGSTRTAEEKAGLTDSDVDYVSATIVTTVTKTCQGTQEDQLPDGTIPAKVTCRQVTAKVTSGGRAGTEVTVYTPAATSAAALRPGTRIVLEHYAATASAAESWAFSDFRRSVPLGALGLAFVLLTALVGGWRGVRAVLGLAISLAVLWVYLLPVLLVGHHQLVATLAACVAIMTVVGYLTHGPSPRTSVALLGTFAGIAVVAGLVVAFSAWARLNPVADEQGYYLAQLLGDDGVARLNAVFLAGTILAGLGILNDVTITQASAVHELRMADPSASSTRLFEGGMRIGRDHLASTVYTLTFAYAGAALPILLVLQLYALPTSQLLTGSQFAGELVRAGVGALGLLLAIPATTGVAALVESRHRR